MDVAEETERVDKILAEMRKPSSRVVTLNRLHLYSDKSVPSLLESSGVELWISDNNEEAKIPFIKDLSHPSKRNILLFILEQQTKLNKMWETLIAAGMIKQEEQKEEEEPPSKKRKSN